MPRPEINWITFSIDGREVEAPENSMLVDAAKYGDVEIPVFCYEPKLGPPVGACRMCLVEIEGIPKLQTGCSTPVKDGMVVHTQTERVHDAQRAVVEFLLINHPLDCPVCDRGGECPLQDITYGWGPGTSRFIEPKRHFKKPLELSPLVAIDRERCILCYRCVRFSQEISEDYQLILQERGAHSYVGTFDGHPYVAPFSGNIIDLCPVGALTSRSYRFRARPWDIEGAGTVCTMCPAQCNVELTVRDEKVLRVLSREHEDVNDGWLCDKGRFAYQHMHVDERIGTPLMRHEGQLVPVAWETALQAAAEALSAAGDRSAALAGGETSNEEASLLARAFREQLGSNHLSARPGGDLAPDLLRALADPSLQASVPDLEFAHTVLMLDCDPIDDAPILDLRLRKGIRRQDVKLAVASARPTALDTNASFTLRHAPGTTEALLVALDAALSEDHGNLGGAATAAGSNASAVSELAELLTATGPDVVILYSERLFDGRSGGQAARALLNIASRLNLSRDGAGLLEIPSSANGRGLREAGFASNHGPGFAAVPTAGHDARRIAEGLAAGDLSVLYLLHADPLRSHPDRKLWETALATAPTVIAHESVLTETVRKHADIVFPAEAYAEKEGTLVHPDGRLQRLRPAIGRPSAAAGVPGSGVRAGWQVITDIARRTGSQMNVLAGSMASQQLFADVPFYTGLTLDEIGGRGLRWPARTESRAAFAATPWQPTALDVPPAPVAPPEGALRLGTFRSLWSSKEVDASPILQYARPSQVVELSPADAARLGVADGDAVEVGTNGTRVRGAARLRHAIPAGSVFVAEGMADQPASLLTQGIVEIHRTGGVADAADITPVMVTPAVGEDPADPPRNDDRQSPPGTGFNTTGNPS